jgi:predicted amidohydrolase YtcJ
MKEDHLVFGGMKEARELKTKTDVKKKKQTVKRMREKKTKEKKWPWKRSWTGSYA